MWPSWGEIGVVFILEGDVAGAKECGCGKDDTVLSQWGLRRSLDLIGKGGVVWVLWALSRTEARGGNGCQREGEKGE